MAKAQGSQFKLVEVNGYSEREVYQANDLESIAEFLTVKTGVEIDGEEVRL